MFAADSGLQSWTRRATVFDGHSNELPHTRDIQGLEGIIGEDATFDVGWQEATGIVTTQA